MNKLLERHVLPKLSQKEIKSLHRPATRKGMNSPPRPAGYRGECFQPRSFPLSWASDDTSGRAFVRSPGSAVFPPVCFSVAPMGPLLLFYLQAHSFSPLSLPLHYCLTHYFLISVLYSQLLSKACVWQVQCFLVLWLKGSGFCQGHFCLRPLAFLGCRLSELGV